MLSQLEKMAHRAKIASRSMALISDAVKKEAIQKAASALLSAEKEILAANEKDLKFCRKKKISGALIDRLTLNHRRMDSIAQSLSEIALLPDPNGETVEESKNAYGVQIKKVRVPLGVVAMVYESRPNVTVESGALCLKAGNSVILRGGSEAIHSNKALNKVFSEAVYKRGIPKNAVTLIEDTDRKNIYKLSRMDSWIDLLIARGSGRMVREIRERSTVPVLGHGKGVCHVYVDRDADLKMAGDIAFNSKVQRPGVCNAAETLLVHREIAREFLPSLGEKYVRAGVALKGDALSRTLLPKSQKATEKDWSTEYLDLVLSVKVVDSLDQAIDHINQYGSGHTDTIVTRNGESAEKFFKGVDSAAVFHNVSTRMHDGGVFGLGAEIGISTQKIHARGTMGVRELTTTKYVALGDGQIRE